MPSAIHIAMQEQRATAKKVQAIPYAQEVDSILNDILYGNHYTTVDDIATIKSGVRKLNRTQRMRFKKILKKRQSQYSYAHFIPASGSGSRLFKRLVAFAQNFDPQEESFSMYVNKTGAYNLNDFFRHLKKLPFYEELQSDILKINLSNTSLDEKKHAIARLIVSDDRISLCNLPKALVPIHNYGSHSKTAFEEQMDCFNLTGSKFQSSHIHFTVSPSHLSSFAAALDKSRNSNQTAGKVTFSIQDSDSDVYCLKDGKQLLLNEHGRPIKRPSGHGALIKNLDTVSEDIVQISNIDNIACNDHHKNYSNSRKVLTGYLLFCVKRIKYFLELLERDELEGKRKKQLSKFLKKYFHLNLKAILEESNEGFHSTVYHLLNAPIRIAGVVVNDGKPGGAPYWSKNSRGITSLQIVEKAEINKKIPYQKQLLKNSTHFNPVDMVIFNKDYRGNKFNLEEYAVKEPSMVVRKTQGVDKIQYLERTGLWNGGMRNFLTMFIQIDSKTFNPVKEITDVLSKYHTAG
ncbi:MAG: DUF4301 family protein [Nonlabens sp.]